MTLVFKYSAIFRHVIGGSSIWWLTDLALPDYMADMVNSGVQRQRQLDRAKRQQDDFKYW